MPKISLEPVSAKQCQRVNKIEVPFPNIYQSKQEIRMVFDFKLLEGAKLFIRN